MSQGRDPDFEGRTLLGVPLESVEALTIDGAHWLEVFGPMRSSAPAGGLVLTFRVGQVPGGKLGDLSLRQGDTITVLAVAVRAVKAKNATTTATGPPPPAEVAVRLPLDQAEALVDTKIMRVGSEDESRRWTRREAALATIALAIEAEVSS